ncbi:MAG: methylenetetrahydrofolate--tRNA-(uracil(54)-C(5))-methyltransferase (FADH(2)-oxidizing) TrmFO [Deltaproteobacteria bacterium]|nr:methylenetetrahydrofolate--tRNA-(uracil(54)-C(5))-methyltransferase (FADH(2)-oxidizing) TrmFO [Deltaproteobacteria bacterium]
MTVTVVGGGLAGCEAAWQLAERGVDVRLVEMRPAATTAAHATGDLAELVCSNSFKSRDPENAHGLLKEELTCAGSLILRAAAETSVPAGGALAVDRVAFAKAVTRAIEAHRRIVVRRDEARALPDGPAIVATGPLTGTALALDIARATGAGQLYFYDSIAPIVDAETIDRAVAFAASRYDKGGDDYLNCPLNESEYRAFVAALLAGEKVAAHDFEEAKYFEGCLPVEVMAARGLDSLAFGPMKPVGLCDPRTGRRPHAVVQLRAENRERTAFNMVGFQTKLKWPEQTRIFRMIPGLERAEFLRLGSVHRNTFVNGPKVLDAELRLRARPNVRLAGQLTGVEGYIESTAIGFVAGVALAAESAGRPFTAPPPTCAVGALVQYVTEGPLHGDFQPMNVNWGLIPPLGEDVPKRDRRLATLERARRDYGRWIASVMESVTAI